jgi:hypothetical protein
MWACKVGVTRAAAALLLSASLAWGAASASVMRANERQAPDQAAVTRPIVAVQKNGVALYRLPLQLVPQRGGEVVSKVVVSEADGDVLTSYAVAPTEFGEAGTQTVDVLLDFSGLPGPTSFVVSVTTSVGTLYALRPSFEVIGVAVYRNLRGKDGTLLMYTGPRAETLGVSTTGRILEVDAVAYAGRSGIPTSALSFDSTSPAIRWNDADCDSTVNLLREPESRCSLSFKSPEAAALQIRSQERGVPTSDAKHTIAIVWTGMSAALQAAGLTDGGDVSVDPRVTVETEAVDLQSPFTLQKPVVIGCAIAALLVSSLAAMCTFCACMARLDDDPAHEAATTEAQKESREDLDRLNSQSNLGRGQGQEYLSSSDEAPDRGGDVGARYERPCAVAGTPFPVTGSEQGSDPYTSQATSLSAYTSRGGAQDLPHRSPPGAAPPNSPWVATLDGIGEPPVPTSRPTAKTGPSTSREATASSEKLALPISIAAPRSMRSSSGESAHTAQTLDFLSPYGTPAGSFGKQLQLQATPAQTSSLPPAPPRAPDLPSLPSSMTSLRPPSTARLTSGSLQYVVCEENGSNVIYGVPESPTSSSFSVDEPKLKPATAGLVTCKGRACPAQPVGPCAGHTLLESAAGSATTPQPAELESGTSGRRIRSLTGVTNFFARSARFLRKHAPATAAAAQGEGAERQAPNAPGGSTPTLAAEREAVDGAHDGIDTDEARSNLAGRRQSLVWVGEPRL